MIDEEEAQRLVASLGSVTPRVIPSCSVWACRPRLHRPDPDPQWGYTASTGAPHRRASFTAPETR